MKKSPANPFRHIDLPEYLDSTQVGAANVPNPVHSTNSANIMDILQTGHIQTSACDVFDGEKLVYLFIGRPSYKKSTEVETPYWMLPTVFILKGLTNLQIKRIYPLDTGAFDRKRLPAYLTVFDLESYALGTDPGQINRIIAAFYETSERYMRGEARPLDSIKAEVHIDVRHTKIEALVRLYAERSLPEIDDRGRNIEVQISEDIPLAENVVGVVMPDAYKLYDPMKKRFKALGVAVEYYTVWPMNAEAHFGQVYEAVTKITRKLGK